MLDPKEILTALSDRFATTGKVQTVYGDPIEAHGKTIIPVANVKYGFGAGGGSGNENPSGTSATQKEGGGGGGGGGVRVTPLGVIEVTEAGTRFIRFFDFEMAAKLVAGGIVLGWFLRRALRWRR